MTTHPPRSTPRLIFAGLIVAALLGLRAEPAAHAAPPKADAGQNAEAAEAEASSSAAPATEQTFSPSFGRFMAAIDGWDLTAARRAQADIGDARERDLAGGIIELYEARYPEAESTLAGVVASAGAEGPDLTASRAAYYLDVARGAQLALGDATTVRSPDGRIEAVFADPRDAILAPYLFEAMSAAYEVLGEDVGVYPDPPVRFEFYDEPGKLALVTPLTLDNIYTTGTVGICKYRRIMMITPRVMLYGYGWLDTAVHEYVHYLVTLRTQNNAPVWLQEGLAKLMETRWRETPGKAGEHLSPAMRGLLRDALANDTLVTLEQMHPSVAMLPSQELAALAYAEAETMIGLLEEQRGDAGLGAMLDDVAGGVDAKQAFADAWGGSFDAFFATWKLTMAGRTAGAGGGALDDIAFREPGEAGPEDLAKDPSLDGDVFSHLGGGRARKHARLGVLLTLRGHLEAAVLEYEKARQVDPSVRKDPQLARRLGELYLELDRPTDALPLLILAAGHDPDNANLAASEARARRLSGDLEGARAALDRALRQNPFIPGIHCDLEVLAEAAGDAQTAALERDLCME